jgi:uncharacterized protein (TIGR03435 family)
MRKESRELLAVGIFGRASLGERIETLLKHRREFSARVSPLRFTASAVALLLYLFVGSQAPRWIAFAQERPTFEVASVKQNKTKDQAGFQVLPSGRLVIANIPLQLIITTAYGLPIQSDRLSGGPDWIRTDRFDIEATPPPGAVPAGASSKVREDTIRQMLQNLLAERFKMSIRRETKDQPVYAAVIGKGGPKLEKSKLTEKDCQAGSGTFGDHNSCHNITGGQGRGLHGEAIDMSDLVVIVSNWTDHPVVDRTGITGLFRIETDGWLRMETGPPPAPDARGEDGRLLVDQPTIFEIFNRLGLKLELQRAPVDMFVIDHIERPAEN